jgi:hypothetical protein
VADVGLGHRDGAGLEKRQALAPVAEPLAIRATRAMPSGSSGWHGSSRNLCPVGMPAKGAYECSAPVKRILSQRSDF